MIETDLWKNFTSDLINQMKELYTCNQIQNRYFSDMNLPWCMDLVSLSWNIEKSTLEFEMCCMTYFQIFSPVAECFLRQTSLVTAAPAPALSPTWATVSWQSAVTLASCFSLEQDLVKISGRKLVDTFWEIAVLNLLQIKTYHSEHNSMKFDA